MQQCRPQDLPVPQRVLPVKGGLRCTQRAGLSPGLQHRQRLDPVRLQRGRPLLLPCGGRQTHPPGVTAVRCAVAGLDVHIGVAGPRHLAQASFGRTLLLLLLLLFVFLCLDWSSHYCAQKQRWQAVGCGGRRWNREIVQLPVHLQECNTIC